MSDEEHPFITELDKELGDHPDKQQVIAEYTSHVYEIMNDCGADHSYEAIVERLGTPTEIATLWKQEVGITPRKTQWLFVLLNVTILLGGGLLTLFYHLYEWAWLDALWAKLTGTPLMIMVVYALFWGLLGYEIGREFGHRGERLLRNTFLIAMIPNIVLMQLIVFHILPHEWFQPVLNGPFILIYILFTALLYPISRIGYHWGRKVSI